MQDQWNPPKNVPNMWGQSKISGEVFLDTPSFRNLGYPQIIHFNRVFYYKPSILGSPYFWKHPNWPSSVLRHDFLNPAFSRWGVQHVKYVSNGCFNHSVPSGLCGEISHHAPDYWRNWGPTRTGQSRFERWRTWSNPGDFNIFSHRNVSTDFVQIGSSFPSVSEEGHLWNKGNLHSGLWYVLLLKSFTQTHKDQGLFFRTYKIQKEASKYVGRPKRKEPGLARKKNFDCGKIMRFDMVWKKVKKVNDASQCFFRFQLIPHADCGLWVCSIKFLTSPQSEFHCTSWLMNTCKMGQNIWKSYMKRQDDLWLLCFWPELHHTLSCRFGLCHRQRCCVVQIWGLLWKCRRGIMIMAAFRHGLLETFE